ncbi:glycosyltransferase family 2 protein [Spongiivirga citrea]|uniref:Glycosyltransferase n=1 Tax=Spongiivirga citrea TaxID=1481457 RepID=A0A6M0CRG8_9FLAO|nr:glycosyltransferase family 2 protein [Spongiivirga citrea]NER16500.1 glycosyltransferase [Spongiivirga citrea]
MKSRKVSILTPFKNTDQFIEDCIQSVINQSYTNWELILVNDHSTDNSVAVCKRLASRDKRIQVVNNIGNGIIEALRYALSLSTGDFITRMDSDDIMHQEKLNFMANDLEKHGKGHVALGLVKYFSEAGISDGYDRYEKWLNKLTEAGSNYSEIYKECSIASPCWMLYKSDLLACDAFNPNDYPEDYDLTFRFYKHQFKCIASRNLLHYWRDYPTRTSRTHEHYAQNYFLDIKLKYFLELDYQQSKNLVVWGAGFKGKTIAKKLIDRSIPFNWICDNPKKIGKSIYGQEMLPFQHLEQLENPQSIVTVANEQAQQEITAYMNKHHMKPMVDYFMFG